MSIKARLLCGEGHGWHAGVTPDHALKVSNMPLRYAGVSEDLLTAQKVYREFFTNDAGSRNMNTTGSASSPNIFTITSKSDRIVSVQQIRISFNSPTMVMNSSDIRRFGYAANAPGLSNGLLLNAVQGGVTTRLFLDPVQNIGDFLYWSESYTNFSNAVASGIDLLMFQIKLEVPVILPAGSPDRLEFMVRDDLRLITLFNAVVHGSQEMVTP